MKNLRKYFLYFIGINLIILGANKFLKLIPEACTLMDDASSTILYGIGAFEVVLGILLLIGKYSNTILILLIVFMLWAVGLHLYNGTYDIEAAVFFAVLAFIPLLMKEQAVIEPK